jgi:hypothetical protein
MQAHPEEKEGFERALREAGFSSYEDKYRWSINCVDRGELDSEFALKEMLFSFVTMMGALFITALNRLLVKYRLIGKRQGLSI